MADALSPALDGKFRAKGTTPGVCYTRKHRERVDLRTISLADAERLVAEGFEFLEAIAPAATAAEAAVAGESNDKPTEPEPPAPVARPRSRRKTPAA